MTATIRTYRSAITGHTGLVSGQSSLDQWCDTHTGPALRSRRAGVCVSLVSGGEVSTVKPNRYSKREIRQFLSTMRRMREAEQASERQNGQIGPVDSTRRRYKAPVPAGGNTPSR